MTHDKALLEAMARAIYDDEGMGAESIVDPWDESDEDCKEYCRATIRVALSAAGQAGYVLEQGWRPIETAPRDKPVMLGRRYFRQWCVGIGWASKGEYPVREWQVWPGDWSGDRQPTHWRPQPEGPPIVTASQEPGHG